MTGSRPPDPPDAMTSAATGQRIELLGLPVHVHDLASLLSAVDRMIASGGRYTVAYANVHTINIALSEPDVAEFMRRVDLIYCDGNGVRLGAWLAGQHLPPRMTGADWIDDLGRRASANGHRLFWLGARPGVAEAAAGKLAERAPGLCIAGTHHGYFAKEGPESDAVVEAINRAAPDIVLVGLGTPLQERWIAAQRHRIDAPVVWAIGATADFLSGEVSRGPAILHQHGLEWLARLLVDPRRLWRRYLVGNTHYLRRLAGERWTRRRGGP
ncbi:MAG: WecB/TagA/CpsF family glycosyltransferase [Myxococcota bacterium]|nr:WecB/TagA/CpsF family glycosyltransferase [Myxococcota bacterium]